MGKPEASAKTEEALSLGPESVGSGPAPVVPAPAVIEERSSWFGEPGDEEDELVNKTLGSYHIVRVLGEGGMGRVYEARHMRIEKKRFAIKVLHPELARNQEIIQRFQREAEAAATISHPNVVGVYDVDRTPNGRPYLVCEYLHGIDLADYTTKVGKLPSLLAIRIARQLCKGLAAAHAESVVHRDLKPQNVFLLGDPTDPTVKILDFGLSRFVDKSQNTLTKTGIVMGTPSYMSPEQARGERGDHRTDIYGVGVILYDALTGRAPFEEESPQLTVLTVMSGEAPRPRSLEPSISERLELVIQRAMAKDANDRYPTMEDLDQALAQVEAYESSTGHPLLAYRPQLPTFRMREPMGSIHDGESDIESARPRLVMTIILATLVLLSGVATVAIAIFGLIFGERRLTGTEIALVMLGVAGTSVTPLVLLLRKLRREVWNNSAKVVELLVKLRTPLIAAVGGYGVASMLVRVLDGIIGSIVPSSLLGHPNGGGWLGWNVLFFVIALGSAVHFTIRQRALLRATGRFSRLLAGPVLSTFSLMLGGAVLYAGLVWRANAAISQETEPVTLPETASPAESGSPDQRPRVAKDKPASPNDKKEEPRASVEELQAALANGVDGLKPLADKYPSDPEVLSPLVLAYAQRPETFPDSISTAKRLFAIAPDRMTDEKLRIVIARIAKTPAEPSELALDLMTNDMKSAGLDLMYELLLTSTELRPRIRERLDNPAIRKRATPALAIAYDLYSAKTCADRVPLLPQAEKFGDERALAQLAALSEGSKRGCGRKKRSPCPPRCAREAAQFQSAVAKIRQRLNAQKATEKK
jgi:serine/threonine-protein kinase